jgi:hypothetical protein
MRPYQIIIVLILLSPTFLCISMEKSMSIEEFERKVSQEGFITFKEKKYKSLNKEFKKKWDYYIPDTVVKETTLDGKSIYKAVPEDYVKNKKENIIYEVQRTWNFPEPPSIKANCVTVNVSQANSFYTEKELKEEAVNALRKKNKKLKHQIADLNKTIIQNRPIIYKNMNYVQKKYALNALMKQYQVRSSSFLVCKIKQECNSNDGDTLNGFLEQDIAWKYVHKDNKLVFTLMQSDSSGSSSD